MDRIQMLGNNLLSNEASYLVVKDGRTGNEHKVSVENNFVKSSEIGKLKFKGQPLMTYDPGYTNTISCSSSITFIDGDKGILEYRGIPIEVLAEKSSFIEVSFLLINGFLPDKSQLEAWNNKIMKHTMVHTDVLEMLKSFRYDAHPMGMLISTMAAYSTFHPEANPALVGQSVYKNEELVNKQIYRIIGTITTLAAAAYRRRIGRDFNLPNNEYGYVENFLHMLDYLGGKKIKPHPVITKALNILFILHADHEQNCSTSAVRHLASSGVDVYSCLAGGIAALYGPLHGGANEAVLRMLSKIGHKDNIGNFLKGVKSGKERLMGFGHRVYKNYDPRAKIIKSIAMEVFEVVGKEPLVEIALALEKEALSDEYFIKRKLYPNVDFYTGVIYKALGFPTDMFPILFAIPRTVGWLAHWKEFLSDKENKIIRPRQNYTGLRNQDYITIENRKATTNINLKCPTSAVSRRRESSLKK